MPLLDDLIPTRWSLIGRLKNWDDHESWREFFDLYWKLIYSVAMKSGLSHSEAEDVVQETIISVSTNVSTLKADPAFGSFKSWLLNATRWKIIDQKRKRLRQLPAQNRSEGETESRPDDSTAKEERIEDPSASLLDALWDEEWEKNLVDAALEKLKREVNARQFQIFYLHVIKKEPVGRVVEALGVNAGQVYLAKHRLSRIFKRALRELEAKLF